MADADPAFELPSDDELDAAWDAVAAAADRARTLRWLGAHTASSKRLGAWSRASIVLAAAARAGVFERQAGGEVAARARVELWRRDLRSRAEAFASLARIAVRCAGTFGAAALDAIAPCSERRGCIGPHLADELGRAPIPSMLAQARAWSRERGAAVHRVRTGASAAPETDATCEDERASALCLQVGRACLELARALGDTFAVRLAALEVATAEGAPATDEPAPALRAAAAAAHDANVALDAVERAGIARAVSLGRFAEARDALERPPFAFERDVATEALRCAVARLDGAPAPGGRVVAASDAPGAPPRRRAARVLLGLERFRREFAREGGGEPRRPDVRRAGQRRRRRR